MVNKMGRGEARGMDVKNKKKSRECGEECLKKERVTVPDKRMMMVLKLRHDDGLGSPTDLRGRGGDEEYGQVEEERTLGQIRWNWPPF